MRPNHTKRLLEHGRPAVGTFCLGASALIAEMLGLSGLDFVMVDLQHGETTPDGRFSFELTNCIGACDQAPAMLINNTVHGNLTPGKIADILTSYRDS